MKIWNLKGAKTNINIEKMAFKGLQIKFLAMHITNQKLNCDLLQIYPSNLRPVLCSRVKYAK